MKLLYKKNKPRQKRISYLHNKRRLTSKAKLKKLRGSESGINKKSYSFSKKINKKNYQLTLPKKYGFESNYEETVISLNEIRDITEKSKRGLCVDFSDIEQLGSTASLVLAGEIYRWNEQVTSPLVIQPNLWNPEIKKALYEMGLFQLLNIPYDGETGEKTDRTFVKFIFGDTTDGNSAKNLRVALEEVANNSFDSKSAFDGITEAMNNVIKHAYPVTKRNKRIFGIAHPWWLGGSYDRRSDTLTITICDHGIGIPQTLPRKHSKEKLRNIFNKLNLTKTDDATMIKAAFEIGRSATEKSNQGKGLQDIRRFVDKYDNSSLKILSLRGEYLYLRKDGILSEKQTTHKSPIHGTVIEWCITLSSIR